MTDHFEPGQIKSDITLLAAANKVGFEARAQGEDLVMTGEIPARGQRPPHTARVTFHDISSDSFQWRYEASLQGGDGPWSEQARLSCRRAGG